VEPQAIGKYRIIRRIGQGAMGEVFQAHDPLLNRMVTSKTVSSSLATEHELRRRFLREAQSAARLNHPNIITVYDFGDEDGQIFMAMELLEGTDLKDLIAAGGLAALDEKLDVMEQVCEGLAFAHSMEVVHRDLKPGNVHVQPGGHVKIMDFGLARLGASEMTRTGTVMGTPHYMSPEQVRGEKADARSDVFALGATFYELLGGRKAFDGDDAHGSLPVLEQEPAPLRDVVELLPILARPGRQRPSRRRRPPTRARCRRQPRGPPGHGRRPAHQALESAGDAPPAAGVRPRVAGQDRRPWPEPRPGRPAPATLRPRRRPS
jgi:serine/threonine-protein kinase